MNKKELEEVFYIKGEIKDLEERIRKAREKKYASDVVQNGYKRHKVIYGIDVKRAYKIQRMEEKLKKFKMQLVEQEQKALTYIHSVPFSEIRQIMKYRYVDGYNWIKVAHKMNEKYPNGRYTEDSVRMKIERILEKK